MSIRKVFLLTEQKETTAHRQQARTEYQKLVDAIPGAHVEVMTGPTDELHSNEVGYFIPNVLDAVDALVVFTPPENNRPKGQFFAAGAGREKPILAVYEKEHPKDLIKRKLRATRGAISNANEEVQDIVRKNFSIFVHEFIHGIDLVRAAGHNYPNFENDPRATPEEKIRKRQDYFNNDIELNAFMQQVFADVERLYNKNSTPWRIDDHQIFYDRVRRFVERNYPGFYNNMNQDSFRKFQKRAMQLWLELRSAHTG